MRDWARPWPLWHISDRIRYHNLLCRMGIWRRILWCEGDEDERVLTHVFHVVAKRITIDPFLWRLISLRFPRKRVTSTSPNGDGHSPVATSTHPYIYTTSCGDTVPYLQQCSQARPIHMLRRNTYKNRTRNALSPFVPPRDTAVIRREDKVRGAIPYSNTTAVVAVASAAGDHRRGSRGRIN